MSRVQRVRLADVTRVVGGTTPATYDPTNWDGDVVWITPVDLGRSASETISTSSRMITEDARQASGIELLPPGSVVMSSRAPIGYLAIAGTWLCTNQGCKSFVPGPLIDSRFLYYTLRQRMNDIRALGAGATFAEVSKSSLERFELWMPPIGEQRAIADRLVAQLAAVDSALATTGEMVNSSWQLHRRMVDSVFEGIAELSRRPLGSVLSLRSDVVHPHEEPVGTADFVGLEHVETHTGRRTGKVALPLQALTGRKPRFSRGDVVYGYLRPYLNKVWVAEFDGLCSVDQYVFKVAADVADAEFVAAYMRSDSYLKAAPTDAGPGQLPRIRLDEVLRTPMPALGLPEQRAIAAELRARLATIDRLGRATEAQLEAIDLLPSALLRRAFDREDAA